MLVGVIACFIIGYLVIVFEHPLKLDKTVPALIMGAMCWALISIGHLPLFDHHGHALHGEGDYYDGLSSVLIHHVGKTAEILIFLIGAMTIVELIDLHRGFEVITNRIRTNSKKKMLWLICPGWMNRQRERRCGNRRPIGLAQRVCCCRPMTSRIRLWPATAMPRS